MKPMLKVISPEVQSILDAATIKKESNVWVLFLPPGQLDRSLYVAVAKILELAGGKWNRSEGGFIFQNDPTETLELAGQSGSIEDRKKTRQAFFTPERIAKKVARWANVEGRTVLEPSAGSGSLVAACMAEGAWSVHAVEIDPAEEDGLKRLGCHVVIEDFLRMKPTHNGDFGPFDRVVMNPPFTRNQYIKHIEHALRFLRRKGTLYAIVPDTKHKRLVELHAMSVEQFSAGEFKESGTGIATRLIEIQR